MIIESELRKAKEILQSANVTSYEAFCAALHEAEIRRIPEILMHLVKRKYLKAGLLRTGDTYVAYTGRPINS